MRSGRWGQSLNKDHPSPVKARVGAELGNKLRPLLRLRLGLGLAKTISACRKPQFSSCGKYNNTHDWSIDKP